MTKQPFLYNDALVFNLVLMKIFSSLFFLLISITVVAQKKSRHTPIIQKGWYLSFNPHSLFELQQGAVGLGIGYRINNRIELWTELNYLYKGFAQNPGYFDDLKGFRSIVSFKYYYYNKHGMFAGAEFRIKNYSFDDKNTFVNTQLNDTLTNFRYRATNTLVGGAVFWGKRFKLTANGKFELEGNVGIGVKQRRINRKNLPSGYSKIENFNKVFSLVPDTDVEDAYPYFPAIFRFIYHL
jgi:Protein of unknown function (DUF3575)